MLNAVKATVRNVHGTTGTPRARNICKDSFAAMTRVTVNMPVTTTMVIETTPEASGARSSDVHKSCHCLTKVGLDDEG